MKRKLIIVFISSFFLSTTGLPVTLHYCQMLNSVSFSDCMMCSAEEDTEESSCCRNEDDYSVQIKEKNSDECCEIKIIDSSVKDNFLLNQIEIKNEIKFLNLFSVLNCEVHKNSFNKFNFSFCDSSPPPIESELYILNSILLI